MKFASASNKCYVLKAADHISFCFSKKPFLRRFCEERQPVPGAASTHSCSKNLLATESKRPYRQQHLHP